LESITGMNEPIYCGLAFGSVSINLYGQYIPCCGIVPSELPQHKVDKNLSPIELHNSKVLVDIRTKLKSGEWHPACGHCQRTEVAGLDSMRTIWNTTINSAPMDTIVDPNNVVYLDLSFGSRCNSKCMTCNSTNSDQWPEEDAFIWKWKSVEASNSLSADESIKLLNTFPNVNRVNFIGGEPTILDEHYAFLKILVDTGRSKDISLGYVTNLTGINDELIDLWESFKYVIASVSIDGYKEVNEYIRYPIKWNKVESNLLRYAELTMKPQFDLGLSCTVSIFNILAVADLFEFWLDNVPEYFSKEHDYIKHHGWFLNRVTSPEYLDLALLSVEYRQQGIERMVKLKERVKDVELLASIPNAIDLMIDWMNEPQKIDTKLCNDAIHFIEQSDIFRNRNIEDYIPGLLNELKINGAKNGK